MVRLAADMGVHKSTILDVMRGVVELWMEEVNRGAPLRLPAGWGTRLHFQDDTDLAVPESPQLLGEGIVAPAQPGLQPPGLLSVRETTGPFTALWTPG